MGSLEMPNRLPSLPRAFRGELAEVLKRCFVISKIVQLVQRVQWASSAS
jgi:hypothetical protein